MKNNLFICPGCGAQISSDDGTLDKDFNALTVCRNKYFELSYFTLSLQDKNFIHQLIVDAYAAQHSGTKVKPIATIFALFGLYLVHERNYTGRQVQLAHIELANKSKTWPRFSQPKEKNWITVFDVAETPDDRKQEMIMKWSASVWNIWKYEQKKIEALLGKYLDINR